MMRAKMKVVSIDKYGEPTKQINVILRAVGDVVENTFAVSTPPMAALQICIQNPVMFERILMDQIFNVEFTPISNSMKCEYCGADRSKEYCKQAYISECKYIGSAVNKFEV